MNVSTKFDIFFYQTSNCLLYFRLCNSQSDKAKSTKNNTTISFPIRSVLRRHSFISTIYVHKVSCFENCLPHPNRACYSETTDLIISISFGLRLWKCYLPAVTEQYLTLYTLTMVSGERIITKYRVPAYENNEVLKCSHSPKLSCLVPA